MTLQALPALTFPEDAAGVTEAVAGLTPFEAYIAGAGTYAVHIGKAILPAMTELNAFREAAGQTPVEITAANIIAAAILASSAQAAEVAVEPKVKRVTRDANGNITGIVG